MHKSKQPPSKINCFFCNDVGFVLITRIKNDIPYQYVLGCKCPAGIPYSCYEPLEALPEKWHIYQQNKAAYDKAVEDYGKAEPEQNVEVNGWIESNIKSIPF